MKYAIVTVSNEEFLPGAEVMIYSLIKSNPWFEGDIIIIDKDLPAKSKANIYLSNKVKFVKINKQLDSKISALVKRRPELKKVSGRFYSLQLFNIKGYDKLLFLDSDTLITGDLKDLFEMKADLACVLDSSFYMDLIRDYLSYNAIKKEQHNILKKSIRKPFNSGVILVSKTFLNYKVFMDLLNFLDANIWTKIENPMPADEIILNYYFDKKTTILSSKYNFVIRIDELIFNKEKIKYFDAAILHYTGKLKPWQKYDAIDIITDSPHLYKYLRLWKDYSNELESLKSM